jgi:hypothetical protein
MGMWKSGRRRTGCAIPLKAWSRPRCAQVRAGEMEILGQREARPGADHKLLGAALALVMAVFGVRVAAAAEPPEELLELQVKAAFLYNFAKFVEWPGADPNITFCMIGSGPLYQALAQSVNGKAINGHPLVAIEISGVQEVQHCNIAFLGSLDKKWLQDLLGAASGAGVLTVGDFDQFAERGGMIQLIKEGNKFRFAINVDSVNASPLRISSKLLQLAEVVRRPVAARGKP